MRQQTRFVAALAVATIGAISFAGQARALTPQEALELSAKTGRPILALAGTPTWGPCVALKSQLASGALRPVVAQFVPLDLKTDGNPDWGFWASKYPSEGNGIPKLYVVRADGEALYAKSGAPQQLKTFLVEMLSHSGTLLSEPDLKKLSEAVEGARKALEEEDVTTAARLITSAPGAGSYAAPAVEAAGLLEEIKQKADEMIAEARQLLESGEPFEAAMILVEANRAFTKLPEQKKEVVALLREFKGDEARTEAPAQAEALLRAKLQEGSKNIDGAVRSYQLLVTRYPNTPVAEAASARLAELGESAKVAVLPASTSSGSSPTTAVTTASAEISSDEVRTWTDRSGKFTIVASMVSFADGVVRLRKEDGKVISVPVEKLSPADGRYIKQHGG